MFAQLWQRGKAAEMRKVVGYGKSKCQQLVRDEVWREGLHYVTDPCGERLYNLTLLQDWVANINDPATHQKACELYYASLPSSHA
jgi:hypothetical protein